MSGKQPAKKAAAKPEPTTKKSADEAETEGFKVAESPNVDQSDVEDAKSDDPTVGSQDDSKGKKKKSDEETSRTDQDLLEAQVTSGTATVRPRLSSHFLTP